MKFKPAVSTALLIFLLAVSVRTVRYMTWPGVCLGPDADTNEISRIAQSIVSTGEFANPYPYRTGLTAHQAPVYPFLLSFVYRLPAPGRISARVGLNILFGGIICGFVYLAGLAMGIRASASLVAALVLAILPPSLSVELCNDQEATLVAVLVVSTVGVTALWLRRSLKNHWALGLFWGFALLAVPGLALVYAGGLLLATGVPGLRRKIPIIIMLTMIVVSPWMIRNRLALRGWFFIRDNLGLELRVSNADNAFVDPDQNSIRGAMQTYHPFFNQTIADLIIRDGELAVYSQLGRDAVAWMRTHPRQFLALTAQHAKYFWLPVGGSWGQLMGRTGALMLAFVGLLLLWNRERLSALLLMVLFILYPLVYYFVQSYPRYRFPIEWAIVLLAVHALDELFSRFRTHNGLWKTANS